MIVFNIILIDFVLSIIEANLAILVMFVIGDDYVIKNEKYY